MRINNSWRSGGVLDEMEKLGLVVVMRWFCEYQGYMELEHAEREKMKESECVSPNEYK